MTTTTNPTRPTLLRADGPSATYDAERNDLTVPAHLDDEAAVQGIAALIGSDDAAMLALIGTDARALDLLSEASAA